MNKSGGGGGGEASKQKHLRPTHQMIHLQNPTKTHINIIWVSSDSLGERERERERERETPLEMKNERERERERD